MDVPEPDNESSKPEDEWTDRQRLRRLLEHCWREAGLDYRAAGSPFGPSQHGLECWIRFEQRTTAN